MATATNPQRTTSLQDKTRELLRSRSRAITMADVAEATGVTPRILRSMAARTENRSFRADDVQAVYEFLTGSSLL